MGDRFSGQVVLVAGGTGGLGHDVSLAFLEEGATLVITYQKQQEFDALRQAAGGRGSKLGGQTTDVTNETSVGQLIASITAKHGHVDVLVNAVGGYKAGRKMWEMEAGVLNEMLTINLFSGYVLSRAVVPVMLKQNRGAIINVAATSAMDHPGAAAAYAASKAAAVAMIDSLAADLKGTGVRANSILPSIIDTEANRRAMPGADFTKWPKAQDVARVILFLSSDDAKLVNGASIRV
jgi:NAD(P)-dependent dehydrogenase (short-subunit alcohol dehydrogenase family)